MMVFDDSNRCSVCVAMGKESAPPQRSRVLIAGRMLLVCKEHAALVAIKMPRTWEDLQALFRLEPDRRSAIPRRAGMADDRRVFPPRPEGRRLGDGRRKTDRVDG
jgi:hypothetical protein